MVEETSQLEYLARSFVLRSKKEFEFKHSSGIEHVRGFFFLREISSQRIVDYLVYN